MSGVTTRCKCEICGKDIGRAGFAYVSHMRAHVRRGQATEKLQGDWKFGSTYVYAATLKEGAK